MFCRRSLKLCCKLISGKRTFHKSVQLCEDFENPIWRTFRVLRDDIKLKNRKYVNNRPTALTRGFPKHADIVIIGGGAIGSSIAYWLKEKSGYEGVRVVVIEKDTTYAKCSTTLSVGGLRQQFSLPENVQMSLYGAEFLRTLKKRFGPNAEVHFTPHGYLVLASEEGAAQLIDNSKMQNNIGAVNMILGKEGLKKRFPWLDVSDLEVGCLGLEKEGWFDPWSLLNILKAGAKELGAQYIKGEVVDFMFSENKEILVEGIEGNYEGINQLAVRMPNGEQRTIEFAACVIAAGCDSGEIAQLAKVGVGSGMLSIPLPVEKRKRYVYSFNCQGEPPGINTPMTIDYTGMYFRREGLGGTFICGLSPPPEEEPSCENLEVDYNFFDERIWPILSKRVPAFEAVKVAGAWSGYYDYNTFDENGIIGPHPYYHNMYIATGFSGHGIQQAPAVGRAISELMLDGNFQTIDLTRFGFDRLIVDKPMYEIRIY
ncbi:FAD-dependent oxidoreductase domain-containing protein 1 [Anoplophora glabripennis]|uniref:FAD-dependent oxidoreductase domain-containing protein 1 n=1 Tax=Anoplophora glabripennis TaxID=217634 RepID=UPI00087579CB|nr:FAD-dependent oxidoreductase domain-containing protein 1 [Anoplophora glabripennis]